MPEFVSGRVDRPEGRLIYVRVVARRDTTNGTAQASLVPAEGSRIELLQGTVNRVAGAGAGDYNVFLTKSNAQVSLLDIDSMIDGGQQILGDSDQAVGAGTLQHAAPLPVPFDVDTSLFFQALDVVATQSMAFRALLRVWGDDPTIEAGSSTTLTTSTVT